MREAMDAYAQTGLVHERTRDPVFRETNFHHIYSGNDYLPGRALPRTDFADPGAVARLLAEIRRKNESAAASLPIHRELMDSIHAEKEAPEMRPGR